jgi:hypothetical protein
MEGSTRHEARPLGPNPDDAFELENTPFAFSPGHLSKLINLKNIQVFQALRGFEEGLGNLPKGKTLLC